MNVIESADASRFVRGHAGLRHGCVSMARPSAFQSLRFASMLLAVSPDAEVTIRIDVHNLLSIGHMAGCAT
jgi:hypothetical protein